MQLKLTATLADETKVSRTLNDIRDTANDASLKALANVILDLVDDVSSKSATKVVSTAIALD